jgi:hypothetical protein
VSVLVASGLAIGGYHNRPLAIACFLLAGLFLMAGCLWVPIRNWRWRATGRTPIQARHKMIGNRALLTLDLGTEPDVSGVYCEVHIPHYRYVGGQPTGRAQLPPALTPGRTVTFSFPDDFGLAPIFRQVRCTGWYPVNWVITQFGAPRVVIDKFHIRKFGFVSMTRLAWERREEEPFFLWLGLVFLLGLLRMLRLTKYEPVQRAWNRLFAPRPPSQPDAKTGTP